MKRCLTALELWEFTVRKKIKYRARDMLPPAAGIVHRVHASKPLRFKIVCTSMYFHVNPNTSYFRTLQARKWWPLKH